jgi:hypothetical protein
LRTEYPICSLQRCVSAFGLTCIFFTLLDNSEIVSTDVEVHLNRKSKNSIEVEKSPVRVSGSFGIILYNYGAPVHVYLHLIDDEIAEIAQIGSAHKSIKSKETVVSEVYVDSVHPAKGRLKIVTGHGAETAYVEIEIVDEEASLSKVKIDKRLASPRPIKTKRRITISKDKISLGVLSLLVIAICIGTIMVTNSWIMVVGIAVLIGCVSIAFRLVVN